MSDIADAKIRMLDRSLQCFACGVLGWLPGIGLPFAVMALVISGQVSASEKQFWNAARPYRIWGVVCAALGTIFWLLIAALLLYSAVSNSCG